MMIGRLRHRITIQTRTQTQDAYGQPSDTWSTLATVWARIEDARGNERLAALQVRAEVSRMVTIRYLSTVTERCRVVWGDRTLEIVEIVVPENRNAEMRLMCKEIAD